MRTGAWVLVVLIAGAAMPATAKEANLMSVDDLILDLGVLRGKTVSVVGYTACAGQNGAMCMLFDDPSNFTKNIFYDATKMGREDRSKVIACNVMTECKVILTGVVVSQPLKTLDVTGMDWGQGMSTRPSTQEEPPISTGVMSVKDFILDGRQMRGKTVTVRGSAQCNGASCWLTQAGWVSQQVVSFEASDLPRDDRKKLLGCSQAFSAGCEAEVTGMAVEQGRLKAASIGWR